MKTERVTLVGLDRITCSIGRALHQAELGLTITGYVRDRHDAAKAKEVGAVDEVNGNITRAVSNADIVIMKVPVAKVEETLSAIGGVIQEHTLVVDLSGSKAAGVKLAAQHIRQGHYVSAAPVLAAAWLGDGRTGIEHADADLFEHSIFCIMPSPKADPEAVETTENLGRLLGATPYFLDLMEYDSLVQGIETVPGLVAAALYRAISGSTGWRDMLRFAGSHFAQATAPLLNEDVARLAVHDRDSTLRWLDAVIKEIQEVRRWVYEAEEERLALVLEDISLDREKWLRAREQNAWPEEESGPEVGALSLGGQLFGFGRRGKAEES